MAEVTVVVRKKGFENLRSEVLFLSGNLWRFVRAWGPLYRQYVFDRFQRFSRGAGNWKSLNEDYVDQKEAQGYDERILVRTQLLEYMLNPRSGSRGAKIDKRRDGFFMQFAPNERYPNGVRVKSVLEIHDKGYGYMPRRTVLIRATTVLERRMAALAEKGFDVTIRQI